MVCVSAVCSSDLPRIALHLPVPGAAPELRACFMHRAIGMEPPRRQRAAAGFDRQLAVERDARSTLDEILCPISLAKAKILEPVDRVKTEAVIELRDVDVGRLQLGRSEEHTSELQSLMRISYAVFCLKKKKRTTSQHIIN